MEVDTPQSLPGSICMKFSICGLCLIITLTTSMARSEPDDEASPPDFQVYTSFDTITAQAAMARLTYVLQPLGITPQLNTVPYLRSLAMANSEGDAELMRVAELHEMVPELTDHLIRVDTPIITARFYAVFTRDGPYTSDIKKLRNLRTGIHKSVLILEQKFPDASIHAEIPALFRLLGSRHLDAAIIGAHSVDVIHSQPNFDESFVITQIFEMPLYLYLNERHRDLASLISSGLLLAP